MNGTDLKTIRKRLGLSLARAAAQLQVSARSIARWEAAKAEADAWKERLYKTLKREKRG